VRVSARADYAVRAALELAALEGEGPVKREALSDAQSIPINFLENILLDLKRAGLVQSQRGQEGGYWLARQASDVSVADVIRAVDGPLVNVRGARPENVEYEGNAEQLRDVWLAARASLRTVLETTSLADLVNGRLPAPVKRLAETTQTQEAESLPGEAGPISAEEGPQAPVTLA
jgi:Rrf2 family protein